MERLDPILIPSVGDPGDETQRNFRYQHAIGALLLIAGARGKQPYVAVWCEHHEDLLAERNDSRYDAVQVKTRRPELGAWTLNDGEIDGSIKRFIELEKQFGERMASYGILSNTDFMNCGLDIQDEKKKKSCCYHLKSAVANADDVDSIAAPFSEVFYSLAEKHGCAKAILFSVLKKIRFYKGPGRENFEAVISHDHLPKIPQCRLMTPAVLNGIRDEIIQKVYEASSLHYDTADQFLFDIGSGMSPLHNAKRLAVSVVFDCISSREIVFRYQPTKLPSIGTGGSTEILKKKFSLGNLDDQYQMMKRRRLSAEYRLLELTAAAPDDAPRKINQIMNVVQIECDEASLQTKVELGSKTDPKFGERMLHNILTRLKNIATNSKLNVENEPYETLAGAVGLLTEDCSVWWSERVDLIDAA